jgi:two-component system, NarL family, nitrate/nitrite response regulator NarL
MNPIRILLADDHEVIRDGVKALLERDPSFVVVGEASSGVEVIEKVTDLQPEVLLMDVTMPPGNGIDAASEIRQLHPDCKIVMLSMHHDAETITRCLEIDVMGYVVKSQGGKEIVHAIQSVHAGKKFYSEAVTRAIIEKYTEAKNIKVSKKASLNELTNREREIIGYIAQGWTNQKIADALFISFRTVETHRANLMRKLEAKNSIELVNKAREHKLL